MSDSLPLAKVVIYPKTPIISIVSERIISNMNVFWKLKLWFKAFLNDNSRTMEIVSESPFTRG